MIRTRVGYAGGTLPHPTYRNLGDHTETVQLEFDPAQVSYADLLKVFWKSHHPDGRSWSRQYQAIIFYHNKAQKELAEKTQAEAAARLGRAVYTEILPAGEFYLAEDYHQKFYLTRVAELLRECRSIYSDFKDFVNSTVVARVNGYAAGYGSRQQLTAELDSLGLSPAAGRLLLELAPAGHQAEPQELCPVK